MWLSHFLTTHVFSGDEVETVEEIGVANESADN